MKYDQETNPNAAILTEATNNGWKKATRTLDNSKVLLAKIDHDFQIQNAGGITTHGNSGDYLGITQEDEENANPQVWIAQKEGIEGYNFD